MSVQVSFRTRKPIATIASAAIRVIGEAPGRYGLEEIDLTA